MENVQTILGKEKKPSCPPDNLERYMGTIWNKRHHFCIVVKTCSKPKGQKKQRKACHEAPGSRRLTSSSIVVNGAGHIGFVRLSSSHVSRTLLTQSVEESMTRRNKVTFSRSMEIKT